MTEQPKKVEEKEEAKGPVEKVESEKTEDKSPPASFSTSASQQTPVEWKAPLVTPGAPPPPPPPISSTLIESLNRTDPLAELKRELESKPGGQERKHSRPGFSQDVVDSLKMLTPSESGDNLRPSDVFRIITGDNPTEASERARRRAISATVGREQTDADKKPDFLIDLKPANSRNWLYEPQRKPSLFRDDQSLSKMSTSTIDSGQVYKDSNKKTEKV